MQGFIFRYIVGKKSICVEVFSYLKYNIFIDIFNRKVIKMISFIRGILEYVSENYIIVEAGGIGYKIFVSS